MTKGTGLPGGSQDLKPDLTSRLCVFPPDELLLLFSCSVVSLTLLQPHGLYPSQAPLCMGFPR